MSNLFESLESRRMLATFTVTNADDAGAGSLRQAILDANALGGADVIEFDTALRGSSITLLSGELEVTDDLDLLGPGAGLLWISGNNTSRIFNITNPAAAVAISGLTVTAGAAGGGVYGGAIHNLGSLSLTNSIVSNSQANWGGGIATAGSLVLSGSTVFDNTSDSAGGIYNGGTLTITNSTISSNTADNAGGIYNEGALAVRNSTIASNRASSGVGGLEIAGAGTATLASTIIAGNTGGTLVTEDDILGTLSGGSTHNLIQDAAGAGGLVDGVNDNRVGIDPLLTSLDDHGGWMPTHALLDGSPALDTGSNPLGLTTDQRAGPFVRTNGAGPDIGAYEHQQMSLIVDTIADVHNGDYTPGDISLREAIAAAGPNPGPDTVTFATALTGLTITLTGLELQVFGDLSITGPGDTLLTIDANNASRVFNITSGALVTLTGFTITGGLASSSGDHGGGIISLGTLTLSNMLITGNAATDRGGGIYNNGGALTVLDSRISGNTAATGAGISLNSGVTTIADSTIEDNVASGFGGGLHLFTGAATLTNVSIVNNESTSSGGGGIYNSGTMTVAGTTISNNSAASGGGIFNHQVLTLTDTTLTNNTAVSGAAIFNNTTATLTIADSTISTNTATDGGGLYNNLAATASITGSTITQNTATLNGGGVLNLATLEITDSTISLNVAESRGGGISNDGDLTITRSTISANTSSTSGGGIFNDSSLTIRESTLIGNSAATSGGGIHNVSSNLFLTHSTVSGNTAGTTGGGIYGIGSTVSIRNSTISGNSAVTGGGIRRNTGSFTISNSTIASNTATGAGAGIHTTEPGGTTVLISSIVANNNGTDIAGPLAAGSTNNLIQDTGFAGELTDGVDGNIIGVDPLLGPLATNGGPTQTHRPLAGSPALDAGLNPHSLTTDQRGLTRVRGLAIDIGAIELNPAPTIESLTPSERFVSRGEDLILTADNVADSDGTVVRVDFYHDINKNRIPDDGELMGSDTDAAGGYTFQFTIPYDFQIGNIAFLAVAVDDEGASSEDVTTSVAVSNLSPTIDSLELSQPTSALGQRLTLTALGVSDTDGTVAVVEFYLDANGNGFGDFGELIGSDTDGSEGYSIVYHFTEGSTVGSNVFLAIVIDNDSGDSPYATATATVTDAISIGSPRGASSAGNIHRVVSVDTLGHVLVFEQGWTFENLHEKTDAPAAIGTAVIWTDPKDGLTYVAAPSDAGLLLFTRAADGTWSFRNLSAETGASSSPTGNLTQFTSIRQKIVVIAGITDDGRVVAFRQTLLTTSPGVYAYTFVDISADLESQGQTTPDLAGLTSYVPSWDTWHLAGVDTLGRIQSIWINTNNPNFTKWRANNLSAITGSPAISGQLAVTLTSWGGINLTGLDSAGNLLTTWWIPRFGGQWAISNLTTLYSGPQLVGGNLTAYTTPWGGINYVGLDAGGTVRVYWWIPRFQGQWAVSPLLPAGTPSTNIPTGALTSSSSPAGTLNVYGTNADGNVLRMAWQPGPGNVWEIEDLTTIAEEE